MNSKELEFRGVLNLGPLFQTVVFPRLINLVVDQDLELARVASKLRLPYPLIGPDVFEQDTALPAEPRPLPANKEIV